MRWSSLALAAIVLASAPGCGGSPSNVSPKPSPIGGALVRLPGNRGFVAIKSEGPGGSRGARAKLRSASIVAVFYQDDGTTPMNPPPSEVVFEIGAAEKAKPVALSPDPADPNRFVSSPGPYANGLQGTIRAKIGGEDVRESFSSL